MSKNALAMYGPIPPLQNILAVFRLGTSLLSASERRLRTRSGQSGRLAPKTTAC